MRSADKKPAMLAMRMLYGLQELPNKQYPVHVLASPVDKGA